MPAPTPTPTPIALSCTAADTVRRLDRLAITARDGAVLTVAIGSSSTAGFYASTPDAAYPAVLQRLLRASGGTISYSVLNKGVGGETLADTAARLQRDAIDPGPQFVVLQVGTNDARNQVDLPTFTDQLRQAVRLIKAHGPVMLMNGQAWPDQPGNYASYMAAISTVAVEEDVPLFDRYALMSSWIASGKYSYDQILAVDRFHPNDFTYDCMARVVADAMIGRMR